MTVYRIGSGRYPANDGEGAKVYGGRWNHKGTAVIYASQSVSLCALEVLVNSSGLAADFAVVAIEIPAVVRITVIGTSDLPDGWDASIPTAATRDIGTNWLQHGATAVLSVPSSIVRSERNYLLNPHQPEFAQIQFGEPEPFRFDSRLWRPE